VKLLIKINWRTVFLGFVSDDRENITLERLVLHRILKVRDGVWNLMVQ